MNINLSYYKTEWLILAIVIVWIAASWVLSFFWGYGLAQGIGPTAIVMIFLCFYDKVLWKIPVFDLFVTIPNLNGSYEGCIEYHFDGKSQTKNCEMDIQQTCSHIKVTSYFSKERENSTQSESKEALITQDNHGNHELVFYYTNDGSQMAGDNLQQHSGFNKLKVHKNNGSIELDGFYFTNRRPMQTMGKIKVKKKT